MSNLDVENLAQRFLDATVNKWGTDEEEVYEVLKTLDSLSQRDRATFDSFIAINKQTNKQTNKQLNPS